jgi:type I restriction enzyme, S subunit
MGEWILHNLGELIEVQNGYAFKSKDFDDFIGIPVIKIKNVASGELRMDDIKYYPHTIEGLERFVISKNDILIALTGSHVNQPSSIVGKVARYTSDEISLLNQRVGKICSLDEKKTNEDYIYWFFKQWKVTLELALNAGGSANQANISGNLIKKLELELPPLPEQHAIASVLSSLDDKIDLLQRQNKTLEGMAETLFRQWFVEEVQEDWEAVKVGDFIRTNISSINIDFHLQTIKYLDTGSFTEGRIAGYQILNIGEAPSRARRIVRHNDVLISTVRPNQKHYGVLKHPSENLIVSTGFCVITCDKIDPHFIYLLLTTEEMTEYLHSIAEGSTSTYPSLKPSDIEKIEFQLPPDEKLSAFSEYADNTWNKIDYNHNQIRTLEKLRDTLLPKLMSGEVRV